MREERGAKQSEALEKVAEADLQICIFVDIVSSPYLEKHQGSSKSFEYFFSATGQKFGFWSETS